MTEKEVVRRGMRAAFTLTVGGWYPRLWRHYLGREAFGRTSSRSSAGSRRHRCSRRSVVAAASSSASVGGTEGGGGGGGGRDADDAYNLWLKKEQEKRNLGATSSSLAADLLREIPEDTPAPPAFPASTLFQENAEEYAMAMTTLASEATQTVARNTAENDMFAPCMVGQIEGQFLKMLTRLSSASRVLDIGTFTGYSALAFAEGLGPDGRVVTLERDARYADVAEKSFHASKHGAKISLRRGDAQQLVKAARECGEKYDIVFLDADKENYAYYYEHALAMLTPNGFLLADNALCSLVYGENDPCRTKLHAFNQLVRRDDRVEQVMLTVREGILLVQKVATA